jgi:tRNA(fMet)-specific endonuclease VapC
MNHLSAVVNKLAEYEELYLPQPALGELYYGAYRSGRLERSLAQIERFLDAVDLLAADKETSVFYGQIAAGLAQGRNTDSAKRYLDCGI